MKATMAEIRKHYGRRYKAIFDAIEEAGIKEASIDLNCGKYLEFWCTFDADGKYPYHFWINIGINNKYNTCYRCEYSWIGKAQEHSFRTQEEAAHYIRVKRGLAESGYWRGTYYYR